MTPAERRPATATPAETTNAAASASGSVAFRATPATRPTQLKKLSRERAEEIIREEMRRHGLTAAGWTYRLGRAFTEYGSCHEEKKRLTFSLRIAELNTEDDLREVCAHEAAHAKAGNAAGHGPKWKAIARACGANPERVCGANIVSPDNKYHATCAGCGTVFKMCRPPKHVMSCNVCFTKLIPAYMARYISRAKKAEASEKCKLVWIEQATGRFGECKADFERQDEDARQAAAVEQPREEPEPTSWTAAPVNYTTQPSLF